MNEVAKVERVANVAVGARCDDAFAVHGAVLNDGGAEIGCAPGAQEGSNESGENADEKHDDGCRAEADPAATRRPRREELPGAKQVQMQPVVPRGDKAEKVDDGEDEGAEAKFEG